MKPTFSGGSEGGASDSRSRRLDAGTAPSSGAGVHCADDSGSFVEFELAIQVSRGDGWGSGWQADRVEKRLNRRRRREGSNDLHVTRTAWADGDVVLKNSGQELGPGNPMVSACRCRPVLTAFGLRQRTRPRNDLGPIRAGRRQHPMISHQVKPRWWHESGQFLQQFLWG